MLSIKKISLRIRIFVAMILLIVVATVLIIVVTVYQYEEQKIKYNLSRFVRKELQAKESIDLELKEQKEYFLKTENLPNIFREKIFYISSILNVELSLFDLKGGFLISSYPLVVNGDTTKPLDFETLEKLFVSYNKRLFRIREENGLSFETSYNYILDTKGNPIGILEIEFIHDNKESEERLEKVLSWLSLVYLFMFIIAIVLAYILSSYITRPLSVVTSKLKDTKFHKRNEKIILKSKSSELSILVDAYNNMIDELEESAVKLATSEREQAWREMAKQVAHEIKNPLTPMRLSVQSFQKKFDVNNPNINERVNEFSHTLIQQIDVMNSIASAFSAFAKMPKQKTEKVEVIEVVRLALDIFNENYIDFYHPKGASLEVNLDKTQLIRIITNLVKNSIQALEGVKNPKIKVVISEDKDNLVIQVKDNGKGISKKEGEMVFEPKFTTKSSGMGLGLPMIKNIIGAYQGSIDFTSEAGKETTFTVILPKQYKNHEF